MTIERAIGIIREGAVPFRRGTQCVVVELINKRYAYLECERDDFLTDMKSGKKYVPGVDWIEVESVLSLVDDNGKPIDALLYSSEWRQINRVLEENRIARRLSLVLSECFPDDSDDFRHYTQVVRDLDYISGRLLWRREKRLAMAWLNNGRIDRYGRKQ